MLQNAPPSLEWCGTVNYTTDFQKAKNLYSQYWNIPRDVLEAVEFAVNGSLDFPLQLKPNEPLVKIVNEVEKLVTET